MSDKFPTVEIPLDKTDIPQDARQHKSEKLESLAQDMKDQGQIQAIVVCANADRYEVVVGVGRVLAARKLGWPQIKAEVRDGLSDFDKARLTYSENEEREDADPFYQASQLQKMMQAKGYTQVQLAQELGQARSNLAIYLSLLKVSPAFRELSSRLDIPVTHLNQLLRLPNEADQMALAQECKDKDFSVRQLKAFVDQKLGLAGSSPKGHKGNGKGAHLGGNQPSGPDPLAEVWPPILANTDIGPKDSWGVSYKGADKWEFWSKAPSPYSLGALAVWFQRMGQALETELRRQQTEMAAASPAVAAAPAEEPMDPEIAAMVARQAAKGRIL